MKRRVFSFLLALCAAGPLASEPVEDIRAFHAAWVIAEHGRTRGEPAMIVGALDLFAKIAVRTSADATEHASIWDDHVSDLSAEALFLSRAKPVALPQYAPERFLDARFLSVPPEDPVAMIPPGTGNRAAFVLEGDTQGLTISDANGVPLCATRKSALFCGKAQGQTLTITFSSSGSRAAKVLLLDEPH